MPLRHRAVVTALAVLACLPLALAAIWLLPWPVWPFVLLLLGVGVWGTSLLTLLVEEEGERRRSHGLVDGYARLRGATGVAVTDLAPSGMVKVAGEMWRARVADDRALAQGSVVAVVGAHGFELVVAGARHGSPAGRGERAGTPVPPPAPGTDVARRG